MVDTEHSERVHDGPWSREETATLARAVNRAPSVHNTQPWSLSVHDRVAELHEQVEDDPSRHDPEGRDRKISCGAALTNLVLAVRELGWRAEVSFSGSEAPLVSVTGSGRQPPTDAEHGRFEAIPLRTSHRRPFDARPVDSADVEAVRAAAQTVPSVQGRWVTGGEEALELARLLTYAARVQRADESYQRELAGWIVKHGEADTRGVPSDALGARGIGAVGLVSGSTHVPDEAWLATRIEEESVLVLSTEDDEPRAHLDVGSALEHAWLEATHRGLGASVTTQFLHLGEVRSGLSQQLDLTGVVQVLMRFGHPADPGSRSGRRPAEEIVTDHRA
ncbi:hypothetical protein EIL87_11265 [Saccharopolyspora rhizosphaerae]|uniref:Nitroreductase domain-containing protein n=1 Tax=Saccharopolyspora rhizosphaerae TaxID=2492662 RepID=A0A426JUH3_9PSEU|nr:nitroreductase family protein [Saccharopolyspora rhizosphaerae]RRO16869.1 hypothetical protein EIL87_11265 [Saccharopolyspora rhizosphaerae]